MKGNVIRCSKASCHPFGTKTGDLSKSKIMSAGWPRICEAVRRLVPSQL